MRRLLPVLAVLVAACPAAPAEAGRLARGPAQIHGLAVAPDGSALAVVDSGRRSAPFRLLRSSGRAGRTVGLFGGSKGEFADVAADGRRAYVSWARPVSGGNELSLAPVGAALGAREPGGQSTGPGRLGVAGGEPLLAFPDERGDVAVWPPPVTGDFAYDVSRSPTLTADAPAVRHHPLDVAATPRGPLVLDLAQRPGRTELLVHGRDAPAGALVAVAGLRHLKATIAASGDLVAAAYMSSGRAVLALARPGGPWSRLRLPGRGGGVDAPAVVIDGERVHVAYPQRVRGRREMIVATLSGGRVRTEQLTAGRADDRGQHAAVGADGELYVAWTRRAPRSRRHVPLIQRLG